MSAPLPPLRDRLLPGSIVSRMASVLFVGILVAQLLVGGLWTKQLQQDERERLGQVAANMGARIGQTIQFFSRLPAEYRHVVLDQLRDMGGTRFFVSVNRQLIDLRTVPDTQEIQSVRRQLQDSILAQIGRGEGLAVSFVAFADLKILTGDNLMVNLSPKWQRFALLDPGDRSPVVVVQLPVSETEWLYLASNFPNGEALMGVPWLPAEQLWTLAIVSLTVLLLTVLMVRWVVKPLRLLATHAEALGRDQEYRFLPEQGSTEMASTIRAFNSMGQRIQKFIADRERLFASISHDLKTPLTRARLRAEMLDNPSTREKIIQDLDDLGSMIHAALQMVKDAAIHENTSDVDLRALLLNCLEAAEVAGLPHSLEVPERFRIEGRAMSLRRLFCNLVDNALQYGFCCDIRGEIDNQRERLRVRVMDRGPGILAQDKERVFEPYFRSGQQLDGPHVGLGLGIARSIAQLHGASLSLHERPAGGLVVVVEFPLSHFVTNR